MGNSRTAMQTLISWGDEMLLKHPNKILSFGEAIDKAVELLEMEKEQIEGAFDYRKHMTFGTENQINTGKEYYEETYNQKQ